MRWLHRGDGVLVLGVIRRGISLTCCSLNVTEFPLRSETAGCVDLFQQKHTFLPGLCVLWCISLDPQMKLCVLKPSAKWWILGPSMTGRLGTKAYLITQLEDLRATPRMISTGSSFAFVSSQDKISSYLIFNVILTSTDRRSRWTCPSQSGNWAGRGQSLGRPLGNALPWLFKHAEHPDMLQTLQHLADV